MQLCNTCVGVRDNSGMGSLLPPCGACGLNLSHQGWGQQVPSPAEPSSPPLAVVLIYFSLITGKAELFSIFACVCVSFLVGCLLLRF